MTELIATTTASQPLTSLRSHLQRSRTAVYHGSVFRARRGRLVPIFPVPFRSQYEARTRLYVEDGWARQLVDKRTDPSEVERDQELVDVPHEFV